MAEIDQVPPDRRQNPKGQTPKAARWPRTERRQARIWQVLARRQPDLTVVLEDVHDPHNISAVLRSCDAVGIPLVHLVYDQETPPDRALNRTTSASAAKWVATRRYLSIDDCYAALREAGFTILATALATDSEDLYDVDLCRRLALVFGNEMRGLSEAARTGADGRLLVPMMGMVQSLNISVACAVTLYETLRQRRAAGQYQTAKLTEAELASLEEEWLRR